MKACLHSIHLNFNSEMSGIACLTSNATTCLFRGRRSKRQLSDKRKEPGGGEYIPLPFRAPLQSPRVERSSISRIYFQQRLDISELSRVQSRSGYGNFIEGKTNPPVMPANRWRWNSTWTTSLTVTHTWEPPRRTGSLFRIHALNLLNVFQIFILTWIS